MCVASINFSFSICLISVLVLLPLPRSINIQQWMINMQLYFSRKHDSNTTLNQSINHNLFVTVYVQ